MQKPAAPQQRAVGAVLGEDPTPTYNNFIRSTLGKGESGNYADQLQGLGLLKAYDEKLGETALRLLSRLMQYGHLTLASVQQALQLLQVEISKDEKALMRIVRYLVLLGLGDGAAGTPLPVAMHSGGMTLAKAVDRQSVEQLVPAWNDLGNEKASFVRKQAALRALAAVARASLTSRPDDPTYVTGLYETLRGLLDKVDELRAGRRGLAHFISQAQGNKKKNMLADIRQRAEMWALLRVAFSAARLALPRSGLYKVAQRSLSALGCSDPVCARHALALASLVARDPAGCGSFIAAVEPLLRHNVEAARRTGALHLGLMPSKRGGGSVSSAESTGSGAGGDNERHLNLRDTWARVYLARACAAAIQSGHIAGDVSNRGAVFWQALLLLAVADPSERVALEAIRAMFGASYPKATTVAAMRQPGAAGRLPVASNPAEVEIEAAATKIMGASWHLVMTQALEQLPVPDTQQQQQGGAANSASSPPGAPQGPAAEGAGGGGAAAPAAGAGAGGGGGPVGASGLRADDTCVFGRVARRLLRCLQSRSHSLVCGAARAVATLAESRAWFHALSGGHGHEAEPEVVRRWMRTLHGFLLMLAGDDSVSGCERVAALEALVWSQGLDQPPTLTPGLMLKAASQGGFTAPPIARYTFADPWPPCLLAELLGVLAKRLRCSVGAPPELVLELAGGLAAGSPVGMPREALQQLWDLAPGPIAVRSALQLLSAPLPPLCQPSASAAVEVKALACQAEVAFCGLKAAAACWLGEHLNSVSGEYAWKSWEHKLGPAATAGQGDRGPEDGAGDADGVSGNGAAAAAAGPSLAPLPPGGAGTGSGSADVVVRMAAAAVAHNPLLAMGMAHLNRAIVTGAPLVRTAAAQALAKLAVRSGEPYRVQCYSLLAAALGRVGGATSAAGGLGGVVGWAADPLGLAPVVGPALEVLDAMYAGELVVERHVSQYGTRASAWPAPALESLRRRHEWLLGAIACCVCAVPRELFLPLGPRSRRLLFPDEKEDAEEEARNAAAPEAPSEQQAQQHDEQQYDEYGQAYQYDYSNAEQYDYGDYYKSQQENGQEQQDPYGQQQDPLARYDFSGQKAAAAVELNWGGGDQAGAYDGAYDAAAVAEARPGVVVYSFSAETEDEVSVAAGESVRVVHDLGEWYQISTAGGQQGLVPASYVQLVDDHAGGAGAGEQHPAAGAHSRQPSMQYPPPLLQAQPSISSSSLASPLGGFSSQPSIGGRQPGSEGGAQQAPYNYSYGGADGQAAGAAGGNGYYPYQYDNPEYDTDGGENPYSSYYGDYGGSAYGADQYGGSAYGGGAYDGGGMYGSEAAGAAAGGKGKKGFGGFDDFGAVLAEAKNAAAAARQQQQQQQQAPLLDASATNSANTSTAGSASPYAPVAPDPAAVSSTPEPAASYGGESTSSVYGMSGGGAEASVSAAGGYTEPAAVDGAAAAGGGQATALYEFVAEMPGELSVVPGEELELMGEEMDGWYTARVVSDPSRQGLIPASYVQLAS